MLAVGAGLGGGVPAGVLQYLGRWMLPCWNPESDMNNMFFMLLPTTCWLCVIFWVVLTL